MSHHPHARLDLSAKAIDPSAPAKKRRARLILVAVLLFAAAAGLFAWQFLDTAPPSGAPVFTMTSAADTTPAAPSPAPPAAGRDAQPPGPASGPESAPAPALPPGTTVVKKVGGRIVPLDAPR